MNNVIFWRSAIPAPIGVTGRLELSDGAYFEASGVDWKFTFTNSSGAETVIFDGVWRKDSIDTGSAVVADSQNIEGSVWEYARFGGVDADLADVHRVAVDAIKKAGDALQSVTTSGAKIDQEIADRQAGDAQLAATINTEKQSRETADTMLEQAVATEHTERVNAIQDVEQKITDETQARTAADTTLEQAVADEAQARTDANTALEMDIAVVNTKLDTIPDMPAADGEYKLVITGGAAAWEII